MPNNLSHTANPRDDHRSEPHASPSSLCTAYFRRVALIGALVGAGTGILACQPSQNQDSAPPEANLSVEVDCEAQLKIDDYRGNIEATKGQAQMFEELASVTATDDPDWPKLTYETALTFLGSDQFVKGCAWLSKGAPDSPFAEDTQCLIEAYCGADIESEKAGVEEGAAGVSCPEGTFAKPVMGCAIEGGCTADDEVEACSQGDMRCCARIELLHEYHLLNSDEGDEKEALQKSLDELSEKLCTSGQAVSCAMLGKYERACTLGHLKSCEEPTSQ